MGKMVKGDVRDYLRGLSEEERVRVRDEFLALSGLSYPSWYGKLAGGQFSRLELWALGNICGVRFV